MILLPRVLCICLLSLRLELTDGQVCDALFGQWNPDANQHLIDCSFYPDKSIILVFNIFCLSNVYSSVSLWTRNKMSFYIDCWHSDTKRRLFGFILNTALPFNIPSNAKFPKYISNKSVWLIVQKAEHWFVNMNRQVRMSPWADECWYWWSL